MSHNISHEHGYAIWRSRREVIEIASHSCHGCVSHGDPNVVQERKFGGKNCLLNSCRRPHFIGKGEQLFVICKYPLGGDIR